jgi:Tfp pilus assembly protein FimT
MISRQGSRRAAGFSFIELLIVLVVGMFLFLLVLPAMQRFVHRANLESTVRQTSSLMQAARLESIQHNVNSNVVFDYDSHQVYAYVDTNANNVEDPAEKELGRFPLPTLVHFFAAEDASADSTNALDVFDDTNTCTPACPHGGIASFYPNGSARAGAVRFGDQKNSSSQGNFIEVRIVTSGTGRIEVRKYNYTAGKYVLRDEAGNSWIWY